MRGRHISAESDHILYYQDSHNLVHMRRREHRLALVSDKLLDKMVHKTQVVIHPYRLTK